MDLTNMQNCLHTLVLILTLGWIENSVSATLVPTWKDGPDMTFRHYATEMFRYKPQAKHLEYSKLMKRMGDDYDPYWMSAKQPTGPIKPNPQNRERYDPHLAGQIGTLNFTFFDEKGELHELKDKERKLVEKWLLQRASCEIHYSWQDLGSHFWPRWIRYGFCDQSNTCSWPPGMRCMPAESQPIKILFWECRIRKRKKNRHDVIKYSDEKHFDNVTGNQISSRHSSMLKRSDGKQKNKRKRMRCKWSKRRYPVTSECFCSC